MIHTLWRNNHKRRMPKYGLTVISNHLLGNPKCAKVSLYLVSPPTLHFGLLCHARYNLFSYTPDACATSRLINNIIDCAQDLSAPFFEQSFQCHARQCPLSRYVLSWI